MICLLVWPSAQWPDVCLPILCLFKCVLYAYLYDVWITVLCLTSCMMYGKLYDVCLPVWCLLYCMSVFLNDVFLTVWWLFLPFPLENSNVNNIIMKTETFQYQSLGSKWNENVAVCLRNVYTETKMFRFSPNVSISKQKHLDLVQNFLYRNNNLSFTPNVPVSPTAVIVYLENIGFVYPAMSMMVIGPLLPILRQSRWSLLYDVYWLKMMMLNTWTGTTGTWTVSR
jgi:hypothetical protein